MSKKPKSDPRVGTEAPCVEMTKNGSPDINEATVSLENWVHPVPPSEFMRGIFRKRALCVHSGKDGPRRVQRLIGESLGGLDVGALLDGTASERVFIWVGDRKSAPPKDSTVAPAPLKSVDLEDGSAAATLHAAGHSAYCRAPIGVEHSLVGAMLRDTGMGMGCYDLAAPGAHDLARGEVEMFFGRTGHVTDWHYDFQENFTVQLSGSKRWLFARSPIEHPVRGHTPHYDRFASIQLFPLNQLSIDQCCFFLF